MTIQKSYHWILMIGSIIGLLASFFLMLDTIKIIGNPEADLACNLSPFVNCTSAATAWQSEVFGFPNPLLGIASFSMLFAVGVMLFSGGRSKKPLWLLVNLGVLAALIFCVWFFFESVYSIRSLCIYCMTIWAVTWPISLYTTVWNWREGHFDTLRSKQIKSIVSFASKYHSQILIIGYIIPTLIIIWQFREYFLA